MIIFLKGGHIGPSLYSLIDSINLFAVCVVIFLFFGIANAGIYVCQDYSTADICN
jgi:hypothetical protein